MKEKKCDACDGCGQVATDEERTPWSWWLELPLKASQAVLLGIVKPVTCEDCGGKGVVRHEE